MIAVIDYGMGNLSSVQRAFEKLGQDVSITDNSDVILSADRIVLPGVGAYKGAIERLEGTGLGDVLREALRREKRVLGICLGMQLFFDYSEEGGENVKGLGIVKGGVKKLPADCGLKIPHVGWNSITIKKSDGIFKNTSDNSYFYFVHSYYVDPEDADVSAAVTDYGINFTSAIEYKSLSAVQFHPEKSGDAGLILLKEFVSKQ